MFKIIVGVFFAVISSLAAADGHGSKMDSCMKAFSDLQIGKWTGSGSGMNMTLGEHFAFTWESETTENNGVYTSSGKNSFGATITNSWTTEAVQDTPSPQWIKEKTVAVTTTDCLEENNVIWVNQTWTGTGVGGDLRFENVNQVTVNKDTIFQTLRTREVGSDQPYGVWWTTTAKRVN
jgi:hypothetical protein